MFIVMLIFNEYLTTTQGDISMLFIQESTKTRIVFTVAIARRLEGLRKVADQTPEKKI